MVGTKKTDVAAEPKKVDKKPEKAEKKPVKADKAGGLKRNMNAYMFFTKDYRTEHAGEGLKVTETARAAGAAWAALKDKSVGYCWRPAVQHPFICRSMRSWLPPTKCATRRKWPPLLGRRFSASQIVRHFCSKSQ
jgi:hypothetical protein